MPKKANNEIIFIFNESIFFALFKLLFVKTCKNVNKKRLENKYEATVMMKCHLFHALAASSE